MTITHSQELQLLPAVPEQYKSSWVKLSLYARLIKNSYFITYDMF